MYLMFSHLHRLHSIIILCTVNCIFTVHHEDEMRLSPYCPFMKRLFENKVLRSVLGSEKEEMSVRWRKLHSEELYNLCSLPNIVGVIKSRRLEGMEHVILKH